MINDYKTVDAAEKAWKGHHWVWERRYFTRPGSACVCKEGDRFFIITHPDCVRHRNDLGQVVKMLV